MGRPFLDLGTLLHDVLLGLQELLLCPLSSLLNYRRFLINKLNTLFNDLLLGLN